MKLELAKKAYDFAVKCHANINHMYGDTPYITHLNMVRKVAEKYIDLIPKDEYDDILAACWCHDVLEDCATQASYNDLKNETNQNIAEYVYAVTTEKGRNRSERANKKYYTEMRCYKHAVFIKLCDRIANSQYSKDKKSSMFLKYQKEFKNFMFNLYDGRYIPMWEELKEILEINDNLDGNSENFIIDKSEHLIEK
jgi:(p)ppGpp synthase/HD superfamily hydrolase